MLLSFYVGTLMLGFCSSRKWLGIADFTLVYLYRTFRAQKATSLAGCRLARFSTELFQFGLALDSNCSSDELGRWPISSVLMADQDHWS